ncbi:MAG: biotin/lipoyl-binding protein [Thermotogae bacterium]|nr:biotin/lipoyl-binding protein [Thermotogota bacterium]
MKRKFLITVNGKSYEVEVEEITKGKQSKDISTSETSIVEQPVQQQVFSSPQPTPSISAQPKVPPNKEIQEKEEVVQAPMSGVIVDIKVKEGQAVRNGDLLLVLEAMKMENNILSPCGGVVKNISVTKGENVETDQPMIVISS